MKVIVEMDGEMVLRAVVAAADRQLLGLVRHMGRTLDDLKKLRVQHQLRRLSFERDYGVALPPDEVMDSLTRGEHAAELELCRLIRRHRLAPFAKSYRGVGEVLFGRLIAEIGDPADRATVSQLWAYCGRDPNRRRRKGMSQDEALGCGNPRAKSLTYLIAVSMLRAGNRDVYDRRREHTMQRDDWTLGHKHNDALNVVAKAFLLDLWLASRHTSVDAQEQTAGGES